MIGMLDWRLAEPTDCWMQIGWTNWRKYAESQVAETPQERSPAGLVGEVLCRFSHCHCLLLLGHRNRQSTTNRKKGQSDTLPSSYYFVLFRFFLLGMSPNPVSNPAVRGRLSGRYSISLRSAIGQPSYGSWGCSFLRPRNGGGYKVILMNGVLNWIDLLPTVFQVKTMSSVPSGIKAANWSPDLELLVIVDGILT